MSAFHKADKKVQYHILALNFYDPMLTTSPWHVHRKDWVHFFKATFWIICALLALFPHFVLALWNRYVRRR